MRCAIRSFPQWKIDVFLFWSAVGEESVMPFLDWNLDFSMGVDALDAHRIAYIDILNEFYVEVMTSPPGSDSSRLLRKLNQQTQAYHSVEEQILKSIRYAGLAQHCKQHREFALKIRDFQSRYARGDCAALVQMPRFLLEWLYRHMLQEDLLYRRSLTALPQIGGSKTGGSRVQNRPS